MNERALVYKGDTFRLEVKGHIVQVVIVDDHAVVTIKPIQPEPQMLFKGA